LPQIIHDDEHVNAAVHGRYREGNRWLPLNEGMLVATSYRIIFLDHKPGYTTTDEVAYDLVSGVRQTTVASYSAVTLHTRIGDFTIRFAKPRAAENFVSYVERRRLEENLGNEDGITSREPSFRQALSREAQDFLASHEIGVLSTVDRTGNAHGAAVYYISDEAGHVFIVTKADTNKAHNLLAHHQVALTVFDDVTAQTVQLSGIGEIEADPDVKAAVVMRNARPRTYAGNKQIPPVRQLRGGAFTVLKISPQTARYWDFAKESRQEARSQSPVSAEETGLA
jgi:general stress protein 26